MDHKLGFLGGLLIAAASGCAASQVGSSRGGDALDRLPAAQALPALTQRLMTALPGDSTVWQRYLSERVVYVSETGEMASKAELLEAFGPFPPGLTGSIEVKNPRIVQHGDVAIMVFDAHERQTVYDQQVEVNYVSTHAWRREDGRWRLIAAQAVVVAKDPPALPIRSARLDAYVGTYELSGKRRYRVERRGDTLVGGREGGELKPLLAVGDNVFAEAGSDLGILRIFVARPDGTVERMVQRRKFADLSWLRVPDRGSKP
jgi:ketosteroid isomerase-like protein